MTLPAVTISKNVFSTSQAPPSSTGILAILAASSAGTVDQPGSYSRSDLAVTDYGYGPLTDYAAHTIAAANQPVVLVKGTAAYAGALGAITTTNGSTSTITNNSSAPYDTYDVRVEFLTGGTIGVTGITYRYSLDGGNTWSGSQALGTATTLTIPNTGVSFTLGAGNINAGETLQAYTTRPQLNDTNITDGLTALGLSRLPFEGVLIDCSAGAATVGVIDTILSSWEGKGKFKFALLNSRYKTEPEPTAESEAAYATALGTTFGNQTSIRACVGADGAHAPSPITGWNLKRPTAMFLGGRAMAIPIGEDPAWVARGPLQGAQVSDARGNPFDHDEDLYPNLDSLRLTSLRSFAPGGPQGIFVTNANTIAPTGSPFAYLQHIRIMNRACEIAWAVLTQQLSRGVRKNPKPDPVTNIVTIFEPDAALLDKLVEDALFQPLKGQVSDFRFRVNRTDNMNAVPCVVTALLEIVALAYIKGFQVQAQFVKTISTTL